MKRFSMVIVVALVFGCLSFAANQSSAPAGVVQPNTVAPAAIPATSAKTSIAPGEGSPIPYCPPHQPCPDNLRLMAGEGSPIPYCPPHQPCPDNLRLMAGEGSPIPYCPPHQPCPDNLRLMAGEGSPIPYCPPHQPCPDNFRVTASVVAGPGLFVDDNRHFATDSSMLQVAVTTEGEVRQLA